MNQTDGQTLKCQSWCALCSNNKEQNFQLQEPFREEMAADLTHILVLPLPVQGHINPMLQFAKRLASKGHEITLISASDITKSLSSIASSVKIEQISDRKEVKPEGVEAFIGHIKPLVSDNLPKIIEKHRNNGRPVRALVYDSIMPWALEIAHQLGLKGAAFFTQSCAVCSVYYHSSQGTLAIPAAEGQTVSLPSLPPLKRNDLPSFISDDRSLPFLLQLRLDQYSNFYKADWLLVNSFDKLEDEIINWFASQWPMKTIGPTVPSMYLEKRLKEDKDYGLSLFNPDSETSLKWLDSKETGSVVYASFGSLANIGEKQMDEIAQGLLNSNFFFLWVVKASEQSKLPANFIQNESGKGLVVNWCPQLEVLGHKAVGCFVTHCGLNSVLEALSLGVPMVAFPQWTDQPTNAKFISDVWRVGVRVSAEEGGFVGGEEIEKCIKQVMEGDRGNDLRRNVVRWKELAKEAMNEGGSSDKNIEEFLSSFS